MKKIVIIFFMIIISVMQLKSQVLSVSQITQEQNQWCWAGASACILDYYCTPTSQCSIAEYTRTVEQFPDISFGSTNCCTSPASCNNWNYNWGGLGSIQDILLHFANISNYGVGSSLTQSTITTEIQNNRVFVIRWGWTTGGGHFIVGHGLIGNNLYYMDPWYGEGLKIADYSWVCSGSNHTWTHTNQLSGSPNSAPPATAGTITGTATVCQGQNAVTYTVPTIANATSYIWTLPSGATGTSTTNSITVNYGTTATSGSIAVKGNNTCGNGATSTLAISVNVKPTTPIISLVGNILHSDAISGNQWYDQIGSISAATNQDYTVTVNGDYYVFVTLLGCSSEQSNTINVVLTGIDVIDNDRTIKVYPNPVSNELIIEIAGNNEKINFDILNAIGQVVFKGNLVEKTTVQTSNFVLGVYLIKLENGKTFEFKKIIKE